MRRNILISIAVALIFIAVCITNVNGTPDQMEYTDEEGDTLAIGDPTGHEDDVDMISLTVDQSSIPIVVTITVKGLITAAIYGR